MRHNRSHCSNSNTHHHITILQYFHNFETETLRVRVFANAINNSFAFVASEGTSRPSFRQSAFCTPTHNCTCIMRRTYAVCESESRRAGRSRKCHRERLFAFTSQRSDLLGSAAACWPLRGRIRSRWRRRHDFRLGSVFSDRTVFGFATGPHVWVSGGKPPPFWGRAVFSEKSAFAL